MGNSFYYNEGDLDPKNSKDDIVVLKNGVVPDKEAPRHRNAGPKPDEEAYTTDEEAVQLRNLEPAHDEDEPPSRNNRSVHDEEAVAVRNNQPMPDEYQWRRNKTLKNSYFYGVNVAAS